MRARFTCWQLASFIMALGAVTLAATAAEPARVGDADDAQWAVILEGFFPGNTKGGEIKRLNCYLVRSGGKWTAALATPTNQGKPVWNTAYLPVDPSKAIYKEGKLTGTLDVTLAPDPWVPLDQKARTATVTLDVSVTPKQTDKAFAQVSGKWTARIGGTDAELEAARLQANGAGNVIGSVGPMLPRDLADASYDLALYNLIPGETKENFQRRRALSLGVKDGKVVSARLGQMDIRHAAYDYVELDAPEKFTVTPDTIDGTISFPADTLDGGRAQFTLSLQGQRVHGFAAGAYNGKYVSAEGKTQEITGFFKGTIKVGAFQSVAVKDDRPWFVQPTGFNAPGPGEHPRLFFRKVDLPELRRRADTPEGKRIIARLRQLLNGTDGETMPKLYNPAKLAYDKNGFKAAPGAYSISTAAGFGFLYQLTGEKKYADLARQCVEKAFDGQRDFDDRYAWVSPGGELRAGPSVGWYAVAYDLCYDGWDEVFRTKVAKAVQDYSDTKGGEWNNPEGITLRKMVLQPRQGPGSNHYGAVVGGSGLAVLAIKGDPGTDNTLLDKYTQVIEQQIVRHLSAGWGDGGYYKEGWGASQVGTQGGFLCLLQAMKVAGGRDFLNVERPNASFITMVPRGLMLLGPPAVYPYRSNMGPTYGSTDFFREREGFSHGGHFSEGFGAVADKYKPGLLWIYNHIVQPNEAGRDFDTPSLYPHRPMMALINWPTFGGIGEENPAQVMPLATRDHLYEYFVFRNRFQDKDDIVTTVLINLPEGTKPRGVMVWGGGQRIDLVEPPKFAKVTHYQAGRDGSGSISAGDWAFAVDYSRASGVDALIIAGGSLNREPATSPKAKVQTITLGTKPFTVLSMSASGAHPEIKVEGEKLIAGKQTVEFKDGKLQLAKFSTSNP